MTPHRSHLLPACVHGCGLAGGWSPLALGPESWNDVQFASLVLNATLAQASDGDPVRRIGNRLVGGGPGHTHELQSMSSSARGTLRTSGINGHPAVQLDAVDDGYWTGDTITAGVGAFTQWLVWDAAAHPAGIWARINPGIILCDTAPSWSVRKDSPSVLYTSYNADAGAAWYDDGPIVVIQRYGGTHASHELWKNGAAYAGTGVVGQTDDPGTHNPTSYPEFPITPAVGGYFGEWGLVLRRISDDEMTSLAHFLEDRWA